VARFCTRKLLTKVILITVILSDAFEGTESYAKQTAAEDDQKTDVSDQSIRAQEFAVTVADPPSSDTGTLYLLETTPSDYLILLI